MFSYFSVNPRTPANRWRRLLKLKRININSFKIIIGFFFTPPLLLAIKVAISFVYRYTTYNANKNRWPTAHKLVFFVLLWVNFVLPWVNFVFPWVNFVVPWLFFLPWQFWATVWATVGHRTQQVGVTTSRATSGGKRKDRNTSGQRRNRFNTSYRDISVIAAGTNSVTKPKC